MTAPVTQDQRSRLLKIVADTIDAMFMQRGFNATRHADAVIDALEKAGALATPPVDMEGAVEAAAEAIARVCHPHRAQADGYWEQWISDSDKDRFRAEARAALAAVSALQRTVPDGWQLVPKDPTTEMMDAGNAAREASISIEVNTFATWHAMLAAAPVLADDRGGKS